MACLESFRARICTAVWLFGVISLLPSMQFFREEARGWLIIYLQVGDACKFSACIPLLAQQGCCLHSIAGTRPRSEVIL